MMKVEFIQDFFMRITVLVSLRYFLTESFANTEATEDSELLCISKHNFQINNWKRYDFHQNNPNFISVSAL
jgi:hypothetical protein